MRRLSVLFVALLIAALTLPTAAQEAKLRAGFVYVGPIGDYGWSHAHDVGRRKAEQALPWLETIYVESVPEARVGVFIDRLIGQGARVIFTTSFGFMDGTLEMAQKYPGLIFAHASGFKRARNMATYMADFYQVYYLNGLMAGALTRSNRVAYVGAFPIPEVKRHLNAFALGVRAVNPRATVEVRWIFDWFSPPKAKEATEALIAAGADVLAFTEDTPTVVQVAAGRNLPSFGHYSPMQQFAPRHVVSGQLVHWDKIYIDFLSRIRRGTHTSLNLQDVDYWWLLAEGAVELGGAFGVPINPAWADRLRAVSVTTFDLGRVSAYDLAMRRLQQMSASPVRFDPFTGPIRDRKGVVRVPAGRTLNVQELVTMEWAAPGVVGPWPREP